MLVMPIADLEAGEGPTTGLTARVA
jgi:hypothetical protein